jgi:phage terminase large subunit-like protein
MALASEATRRLSRTKLKRYKPYAKQKQFHANGATDSERLFMAGNQLGKTVAGGAEWSIHATGRYPDWWQGAVFDKPPLLWAGSVTGESTRDNPQRVLVGPPPKEEEWGTGFLPGDALLDWDRAMGVPNLLDNVQVRWGGGGDVQAGVSIIAFKAYEKGREKWQGPTVDGVWFDEEPPLEIYTEGLTRTNNGQRGQFSMLTFTPLLGMSDVVHMFIQECGLT